MSAHIEPVNSDHDKSGPSNQPNPPKTTPFVPQPSEDAAVMIKAIDAIIKMNIPAKVKLREPDPFDGSDPRKLRTFLLQCKLNFRDRKDHFQDDLVKVSYVLSFLKGMALECFEPGLLEDIEPAWLSNFALFVQELESNFGTYNPVGEAESELEALHMQESHQATKYFIKFTQLTARVHWGEAALLRQAYNGLVKRIKNNMVHHDKLTTLAGIIKLVQAIDLRYWECKAEVSQETTTSGSSGHKNENKSSDNTKSDKGKSSSQSKQKSSNQSSGSSQSKGSSLEPKKTNPDLSSKLEKDSKLTQQERQRCLDKNLCLFCRAPGHMAKDCPKCALAKARAAKLTQDSASTSKASGSDSKKD